VPVIVDILSQYVYLFIFVSLKYVASHFNTRLFKILGSYGSESLNYGHLSYDTV
jgi:hypothetical protein